MPRLIDADVLMPNAEYKGKYDTVNAYDILNCPTVDAVEVVRCKDCRWLITAYCPIPSWERRDNRYCYKGERIEDDNIDPYMYPCTMCEDFDGKGGCMSKGGCGDRRKDDT